MKTFAVGVVALMVLVFAAFAVKPEQASVAQINAEPESKPAQAEPKADKSIEEKLVAATERGSAAVPAARAVWHLARAHICAARKRALVAGRTTNQWLFWCGARHRRANIFRMRFDGDGANHWPRGAECRGPGDHVCRPDHRFDGARPVGDQSPARQANGV